jgi:hypothetical protein
MPWSDSPTFTLGDHGTSDSKKKKGVRDNFRDNLQAMSGPLKLFPTLLLLLRETLSRIKDKNRAKGVRDIIEGKNSVKDVGAR